MFIKNYLESLIEYQSFVHYGGLSLVSGAIFVALSSALIQGIGILNQNKIIWKNRSSKALPLAFFVFQFFYCLGYALYGFKIHSGALIISNLIALLYLPIIIGLIKYRDKGSLLIKTDLIYSGVFILIVPIILFVDKKWSLLIVLAFAVLVISRFAREFYIARDTSNISCRYIIMFLVVSLVWLSYGLLIRDFGLIVSCAITALAALIFLVFYMKLKSRNLKSS